jgi:hypothetical protein
MADTQLYLTTGPVARIASLGTRFEIFTGKVTEFTDRVAQIARLPLP